MIDAEQARVTHIDGEKFRKAAPIIARHGERIGRRQMPDLAVARERVGRRADGDGLPEFARPRPGLGAVGRRADSQIAIQAETEPTGFRPRGGAGELTIGEPLKEQVIVDALAPGVGESGESRWRALAQNGGPAPPIRPVTAFGDRLEAGEAPQRLAASHDERIEFDEETIAWLRLAGLGESREARL